MAVASIKSTKNNDPITALIDTSREDLAIGDVVTLESIGVGAITHSWSVLFSPNGSAVGLTSTNTAVTQFAVDVEGAYLIRLVVDAGEPTEAVTHLRFRVLTEFGGLQLVAAGERRDEEALIPSDIGMYGWAYEQNGNIRKILGYLKPLVQSGRVVTVDSGAVSAGDFGSIQDAIDYCEAEGASADEPYVVLVREGEYEEALRLKPFVHLVSVQNKNSDEIPDLASKPKFAHRTKVLLGASQKHIADFTSPEALSLVVGISFVQESLSSEPMFEKTGEGVLQTNACTFENLPVGAGQGAVVDLQGGRYIGLDCRYRMTESGDAGNFAFLQSGEDTTSMFVDCSFTAPSGLAINPNQHNVGGVINVLRNCTVKTAQYGVATNGTTTIINTSLVGGSENLSINWLGSSYGVSNSGNSVQTIMFSEIEGDIYWNKDNTNHNNVLKLGSVGFENLAQTGTGSPIAIEALTNALSVGFDSTLSSLTSDNIQEAILELEGLLTTGVGTAVNIGTGEGIFKQKTGADLELRSLTGTLGIQVSPSASGDELEIAYTGAGISNQINQLDSSVVVSDSGSVATIDFNINATNEWRVDGVGDLLSMNGGTLGSSASYIPNVYSDAFSLDTTAGLTAGVGQVVWNDTDGTLDVGLKGGNVTLQVGQESVFRAVNVDGVQINNGQVVRISGAQGASKLEIVRASNDDVNAHSAIGVVTENILVGGEGYVTTYGRVRGLNTSTLTGNEGEPIYLGLNGELTMIKPNIPNYDVEVGYLVRKNNGNGQIFVRLRDIHIENWQEDTSEHFLPFTTDAQNIGSPTLRVNEIYAKSIGTATNPVDEIHVSGNTLYIGGTPLSLTAEDPSHTLRVAGRTIMSIPDAESFDMMPPDSVGIGGTLPSGYKPLVWDNDGNANHIMVNETPTDTNPLLRVGETEALVTVSLLMPDGTSLYGGLGDDLLARGIMSGGIGDDYIKGGAGDDYIGDTWTCLTFDLTTEKFVVRKAQDLGLSFNNLIDTPTLFSGNWGDLINKPTSLSDFTNDLNFITSAELPTGDYNDLLNKPSRLMDFNVSVAPSSNGQTLVYDANSAQWIPTPQSDLVVNYNNLLNKPVAFSGDYNDLLNKPNLFNGDYNNLSNKPTLFSGNYDDLNNTPSLFSGNYDDLSNKPTLFDGNYNALYNKPSIPNHINDLTMPANGTDGDVLTRTGNDVQYTDPADLHIDDIFAHTMLAQGNASQQSFAELGYLHLISLKTESFSLVLPSAATAKTYRTLIIKLIDHTGEFTLTITPADGEVIDKQNSIVLNGTHLMKAITLYSDGSNWWII